jgi:uncharacterized membrane protein
MTNEPGWMVEIAILAMAAATYPMRAGGFWLMGHVPLTPRIQKILAASPGAVIVATILPIIVREGVPAALAILAGGAVMSLAEGFSRGAGRHGRRRCGAGIPVLIISSTL